MSARVFGVGVDLLRLERVERVYARHGQRFVRKILCAAEQEQLRRRSGRAARYLAMCFAAKEAAVKALGTGFRGVGYRDFGVVHEASGKPVLVYSGALEKKLHALGVGDGHVSLTDEGGMICAFVVLEKRG